MGVVKRWNNSEMSLRQQNMPIINVRHNGNNRWKRKAKKTKTERSKGMAQAIVKVWELDGFVARLS